MVRVVRGALVGLQGSESVDDSSSSSAVHALVESPTGIGDRDGRALEFPDLVGQARVALPNLETDVVVRACSCIQAESRSTELNESLSCVGPKLVGLATSCETDGLSIVNST